MALTLEENVDKHDKQISGSLAGKKYLEGLPETEKPAADRIHIDKVMANTNYLHGDGLFPVKDSLGALVDSNGKVSADGTSMVVSVSDYIALIDGYMLGNKNLTGKVVASVTIEAADATYSRIDLVCLKPSLDTKGNRQHAYGEIFVVTGTPSETPVDPEVPLGSILLAKVSVGPNVTVLSNDDIEDARKYVWDVDELYSGLSNKISKSLISTGLSNLDALINIAKTNFKIDSRFKAAANNMYKGWDDVFADVGDIESSSSSDWEFDADTKSIKQQEYVLSGADLVGIWHFDEGQGDIALDSSGNAYHGVIRDPYNVVNWVDGYKGKALEFTDPTFAPSDVYTGHHALCDPLDRLTIEARIKLYGLNSAMWWYSAIVGNGWCWGQASYYFAVSTRQAPGKLFMHCRFEDGTLLYLFGNSVLSLNQWYKVKVVRDGASVKLYINDIEDASAVCPTGKLAGVDSKWALTLASNQRYDEFWGVLDEVVVSGGELVRNEVEAIVVTKAHNATSSPDSILLSAEGDSDVQYFVSRDNGTTWTQVVNNSISDISAQPVGNLMRVKMIIPVGKKVDNLSLWWS